MQSASRSATASVVRCVFARGIVGRNDASRDVEVVEAEHAPVGATDAAHRTGADGVEEAAHRVADVGAERRAAAGPDLAADVGRDRFARDHPRSSSRPSAMGACPVVREEAVVDRGRRLRVARAHRDAAARARLHREGGGADLVRPGRSSRAGKRKMSHSPCVHAEDCALTVTWPMKSGCSASNAQSRGGARRSAPRRRPRRGGRRALRRRAARRRRRSRRRSARAADSAPQGSRASRRRRGDDDRVRGSSSAAAAVEHASGTARFELDPCRRASRRGSSGSAAARRVDVRERRVPARPPASTAFERRRDVDVVGRRPPVAPPNSAVPRRELVSASGAPRAALGALEVGLEPRASSRRPTRSPRRSRGARARVVRRAAAEDPRAELRAVARGLVLPAVRERERRASRRSSGQLPAVYGP